MGEWQVVIPRGGRPQARLIAVLHGLFLVGALAVTWTGHGSWGTVFLSVFLTVSTLAWWRIARTGVYIGPRGVKLYYPFKRLAVVPWDEVVRFEVHPVYVQNMSEVGATISLIGSTAHPTPVKLARNWKFDVNAYKPNYDVVLPEYEFFKAVDRLNKAIRPHLVRSPRPDGPPQPPTE